MKRDTLLKGGEKSKKIDLSDSEDLIGKEKNANYNGKGCSSTEPFVYMQHVEMRSTSVLFKSVVWALLVN